MTITLHSWMLVPGAITLVIGLAAVREAFKGDMTPDDFSFAFFLWAVLMIVSGLSIWSAA